MERYLKLTENRKLEIKFTPKSMARFQRITKMSMGYFVGLVRSLEKFIKANQMTPEDQAIALNSVGYNDLEMMMLAGCPEIKTLDDADNIVDDLEDGLFQNIGKLIEGFAEFMNGNILAVPEKEAEDKPNPTEPKPKQKKPLEEVKNQAE
jgi:hypothetical protein